MSDKKKKRFLKPELVKFDKPLDEVTLCQSGSGGCDGCDRVYLHHRHHR